MKSRRFLMGLLCLAALARQPAVAEIGKMSKDEATLVVRGDVVGIYTRTSPMRVDTLVVILVEKVERGEGAKAGEVVYASCFRAELPPGFVGARGHTAIPKEGEEIRAYLFLREQGVLAGLYPDWFEPIKPQWSLGVYTHPGRALERYGLLIDKVIAGGHAQRAGLQPGDLIMSADGRTISDVNALLKAMTHCNGSLKVEYFQAATGQEKSVTITPNGKAPE